MSKLRLEGIVFGIKLKVVGLLINHGDVFLASEDGQLSEADVVL
jgi:hypothetical protein